MSQPVITAEAELEQLNSYIEALEMKINDLAQDNNDLQAEKTKLFEDYIDSQSKLFRIGD